MSVQPVVQYASRTDVGMRRSTNQDSLTVRLCQSGDEWVLCGHLFVVADGMGGHAVGDLASRITVETLPLAFTKAQAETIAERLTVAIEAANRAINDKARENPEFSDMGTTCSVLSLSAEGAWIGHVGDSRVYRIRGGVTEQLTCDHSLQWEMIRHSQATPAKAESLHPANVITRCLGPDQNVLIDIEGPFDVRCGDRFLLCSDGLTGHVSDTEIGAVVSQLSAAEASRLLVDLANCRGGADNTTVVIAIVDDYPPILSETVETSKQRSESPEAVSDATIMKRSGWSRLSLRLFALLSLSGLVLLTAGYREFGLILVSVAVLQGIVRLIVSSGRRFQGSPPEARPVEGSAVTAESGRIAAHPPYRKSSAALKQEFLEQLAAAQGKLTEAARNNGWELDFDQLARLNQHAVTAAGKNEAAGSLRARARALQLLMKAFTSQARARG